MKLAGACKVWLILLEKKSQSIFLRILKRKTDFCVPCNCLTNMAFIGRAIAAANTVWPTVCAKRLKKIMFRLRNLAVDKSVFLFLLLCQVPKAVHFLEILLFHGKSFFFHCLFNKGKAPVEFLVCSGQGNAWVYAQMP